MATVRTPAVAGMFYPNDSGELNAAVTGYLDRVEPKRPPPKALIAPHAGFVYSGPIAASAYSLLTAARERIKRVVLLGPAHRVAFRGLAVPSVEQFATPLGVGYAFYDYDDERGLEVLSNPDYDAQYAAVVENLKALGDAGGDDSDDEDVCLPCED